MLNWHGILCVCMYLYMLTKGHAPSADLRCGGKTDRKTIQKVVLQGDVFGSLLCSNQVDMFGKECMEEKKYIYKYKGVLDIPPLGMVDDLLCVSECVHETSMINAFINHKTHSRKLQFGPDKCKKLHIGKTKEKFFVGGWKMKNTKNINTGVEETVETFEESEQIKDVEQEKYLGDIISIDGKYTKTIQNRINKGQGAITNIMQILGNIYLGKYHFLAAATLRNSLLISTILFNSETW